MMGGRGSEAEEPGSIFDEPVSDEPDEDDGPDGFEDDEPPADDDVEDGFDDTDADDELDDELSDGAL